MAYDSLKAACEKLKIDYRLFHLGKGNSLHRNASIQFDLKSHHVYSKNGVVIGLDFPETLLYLVKYYEAEDTFLVWRRYELGGAHNPNASKAEVESALTGKEEIHIVDHRQGTAYGPQSPVFMFHADHAEAFLNQIVIPELPLPSIADIRMLPMGKEEFESKADADDFILHDLKRYGLYYYRKKSFTNNPCDRIFVLFQYDGRLVGCGEKVYQKQEKTGDYSGYYEFDTDTVRLFDNPITAGEFLPLVDNTINSFSQALHKIDTQYLERIVSYINLNCVKLNDTEAAIIETVESSSKTGSEGRRILYYGTRYERDPKLREAAIDACRQRNGALICEACRTNYEGLYGELGFSAMEVHHIKPLGQVGYEHDVNPETDLVCLCANCHKMIHHAMRTYGRSFTVDELRDTILNSNNRTDS